MRVVDLRSDTVTLPTPAMRKAMYEAELGDDVMGEDPTVNRLEALAAEMVGKEAAVFVPSGSMGNLISILSHCQRGDEVIMGHQAHTFVFEVGAASVFGGLQVHTVPNRPDGTLEPGDVLDAIRGENVHFPRTGLVCLENSHNKCGGWALTVEQMDAVCLPVKERGIPVHLDGARIFNAAVALEVDVKQLTRNVDSVMFCLSKGLSAPVGSMVAGSEEFIVRARKNRKMVGGGMRQAGVLAAAGIIGLTQMVDRLADDHHHAQMLADGLREVKGIEPKLNGIRTNMTFFELTADWITPSELLYALKDQGVKVGHYGKGVFRAATHYGIEEDDVHYALDAFGRVMSQGAQSG
jgi:threonine aldolase